MARKPSTKRSRDRCRDKVRHRHRTAANKAMVRLLPERVTRPYHCPHCSGWHLTGQP